MSAETQAAQSVFTAGADLWITPEPQKSNLVQQLDWYLNFQISKSIDHRPMPIPAPVLDILKNCALEGYDWAPEVSHALLILASPFVPARWVMVLEDSEHLESWAKLAVEKWKKMNSPSVRVFLPHNVSASKFEAAWKKAGGSDSVAIVTDTEDQIHG